MGLTPKQLEGVSRIAQEATEDLRARVPHLLEVLTAMGYGINEPVTAPSEEEIAALVRLADEWTYSYRFLWQKSPIATPMSIKL